MAPVANISTPPNPAVRREGAMEVIICWDYKEVLPWIPGSDLKEGTCGWECGLQLLAAESKEAEGTGLPL